jgi:hypothetical protein
MKKINIFLIVFLIILSLIVFILFFYVLITNNNKLIKFRVIKEPINEHIKYNTVNYDNIKNKYLIKKCQDICKNDLCDEYQTQAIKYDLCKECKKENKCYDYLEGICVPCKNKYTCEELYGCNNSKPIDPVNNFCTRCWIKN